MATFKAQVESWVGTVSDTTSLDVWLSAAARWIINLLPSQILTQHAVDLTDAGSGIASSTHRVIEAHKAGYPATFIRAAEKGRYADANSIFAASAKTPVAYLENDKTYVLPGGGTVRGVAYPTVGNGDSAIANFPDQLEPAVSLYAALQFRIKQLSTLLAVTDAFAWSAPTPPTPPADASYSYSDATVGTIAGTTIDALGTAPTYTKPTVSLPAAPAALDTSAITAPALPTAPGYSYVDATGATIGSTTIASLPTAPTYVAPASPASFAYTNAIAAITTNEDIELGEAELQLVQTQLAEYKTRLEDSLANFQVSKAVYEAGLQKNIAQAQIDAQKATEQARITTDVDVRNRAAQAAQGAQLYASVLQKFAGDLNEYTAKIETAIKTWTSNLQSWQIDRTTLLQQYAQDIENELHEFEKENVAYQTTLKRAVEQAQLDQARLIAVAQLTTDVNIKNKATAAASQAQLAAALLDKFAHQVSLYQTAVQSEAQRLGALLQRSAESLKEVHAGITELRAELQSFVAAFLPKQAPSQQESQ